MTIQSKYSSIGILILKQCLIVFVLVFSVV
ncbi:unnamed protein product, partial [Nezara viridula]